MTQRERLIELVREATDLHMGLVDCVPFEEYVADHLFANGVIVPPCKVGDKLYDKSGKVAEVQQFYVDEDGISLLVSFGCDCNCENCAFNSWAQEYSGEYSCDGEFGTAFVASEDLGKTVFLTRQEAERKLEEGKV